MVIKIALIGSHGTGKTIICHELVSSLRKLRKDTEFLGEIARECPLPINEGTTKEAQKWILHTQIAKEIELGIISEYLVCDRSVFDNYMYYIRKFGGDYCLDTMLLSHMETYDHLFKVPIRPEYLIQDSKRSIDRVFQREIDELLTKGLMFWRIKYHEYKDLKTTLKIILRNK